MTKIIAEIGVNWFGDIEIAKEMIVLSKRAGADFVKFQMFDYETIKNYSKDLIEQLTPMILDYSALNILRGHAFKNNIGFGITPMYPKAFDTIEKIGVPVDFIKIRHKDHQNGHITRPSVKYCDKYDVPLLVSTDRYIKEVDYYNYNLYNTKHVKYLYCIPEYPPELKNIGSANLWKERFEGYSNHYPSKYLPMIAVSRNIEFVEIHVKLENTLPIDWAVSLGFSDLGEICNLRDIISEMRG